MDCYADTQRRLHSLLAWLLRHGRHVQHLELRVYDDSAAAEQLLFGCLVACAAARRLEELAVVLHTAEPLAVGAWAPALARLRRLELRGEALHLTASLASLTALRKLCLAASAGALTLAAGARLPPAVEELRLELASSAALPGQARWSTLLACLLGASWAASCFRWPASCPVPPHPASVYLSPPACSWPA